MYPAHFLHPDLLRRLISLLTVPASASANVSPPVLSVLTCVGKYKPIGKLALSRLLGLTVLFLTNPDYHLVSFALIYHVKFVLSKVK